MGRIKSFNLKRCVRV